jgi:hypothetical protein
LQFRQFCIGRANSIAVLFFLKNYRYYTITRATFSSFLLFSLVKGVAVGAKTFYTSFVSLIENGLTAMKLA